MRPGHRATFIGGLVAALMLTGCGDEPDADGGEGLVVVATTPILGDLVANVVDGSARVEILMPSGVDPHDFQPSSQQIAAMSTADLVVANGLGLEDAMSDAIEASAADGARVVSVAPLVEPIPLDGVAECDPVGAPEGCDPHVWMDPLRMAEAAEVVAGALAELDPGTDWLGNARRYGDELGAADTQIAGLFDGIAPEERRLVTSHESFGYFADRYGFEVLGAVVPGGSTLAEPSSGDLAGLVEVIESAGVPAIFVDAATPPALAEAVAAEAGVDVVALSSDSLGEPGSGADTLIGMLVTNAERIAEAWR